MTKKERSDWQKWWWFLGRRVRESAFLGAWVGMTYTLNVYVLSLFPVHGPSKYLLFIFEILFILSTLIEVIHLLYWPYRAWTLRWLRRGR